MTKPRNLAFVTHWYERQEAGLIPVEFLGYSDASKDFQPRVPRRKQNEDPSAPGRSARRNPARPQRSHSNESSTDTDGPVKTKAPPKKKRATKRATKTKQPAARKKTASHSDEAVTDTSSDETPPQPSRPRKRNRVSSSEDSEDEANPGSDGLNDLGGEDEELATRRTSVSPRKTHAQGGPTKRRNLSPEESDEELARTPGPSPTFGRGFNLSPASANDIDALFTPDPHLPPGPSSLPPPPPSPSHRPSPLSKFPPVTPSRPAPLPDINGLLMAHLASLIQGQEPHLLLAALQQGAQPTPSHRLADSLNKVKLDASPSKPSASSKHRRRNDTEMDVEEDDDGDEIGGDEAEERRRYSTKGKGKGRARRTPRERANEEEDDESEADSEAENLAGQGTQSTNVEKARTRKSGRTATVSDEDEDDGHDVKDSRKKPGSSKATAKVNSESKKSKKTKETQTGRALRSRGKTHESGGDRTEREPRVARSGRVRSSESRVPPSRVPPSPSKADMRLLAHAETLVGGLVNGKREPKKKVRAS